MKKMQNWAYTEKVKEHFINPRNVLQDDDNLDDFDGKGIEGNIKCGDEMMVAIKVDKRTNTITDCKWKTYGCASAIASTSMMSEMVIGMTVDKAYKFSPKDIASQLGGLPEHKIHCSVLGDKALREAIKDYYKRNNMDNKIQEEGVKVVCTCMNITNRDIESAVLDGVRIYEQLQEHTKCGTVCGKCKDESIDFMNQYIKEHF
ncbi:iron-sulfur cluster assembly scaffold protein [Candidatus Margulisiibacteriota bacterium]